MKNIWNPKQRPNCKVVHALFLSCACGVLISSCASKDTNPLPTSASANAASTDSTVLSVQRIAAADEPNVSSNTTETVWQNAQPLITNLSAIGGGSNDAATQGAQTGVQIEIKSVYSPNNIFFLIQYDDASEDILDRPLRFLGGDYMNAANWTLDTNSHDDGLSLMFEITPGVSGLRSFKTDGCAMACHTTQTEAWKPGMFAENTGRYDLWYWRSSSSNATGLAHDMVSEGSPTYAMHSDLPSDEPILSNIGATSQSLPQFIVGGTNSGLNLTDYISGETALKFGDMYNTVTNQKWAAGDVIPSTVISKINPQGQSDAWDVKSLGYWENGKWTVKFKRALVTQSSTGALPNDIAFQAGAKYPFSFAIHNNNAPGSHYGVQSHPFTLWLKN